MALLRSRLLNIVSLSDIKRKWNHVVFSRATILSFHPVIKIFRSFLNKKHQISSWIAATIRVAFLFLFIFFFKFKFPFLVAIFSSNSFSQCLVSRIWRIYFPCNLYHLVERQTPLKIWQRPLFSLCLRLVSSLDPQPVTAKRFFKTPSFKLYM